MASTEEIVVRNLEDAKENEAWMPGGYLSGYSAEDIAKDMVLFAADCENLKPSDIVEIIRAWMTKNKLEPTK